MKKIPVSVLMPVFNAEVYLQDAIESILTQSFSEFEFLIIDGGSADNTVKIVNSYNDPRIKLITNPEGLNFVDALNLGISLAQGKYIARMDADDLSYPDRIEKQYFFMEHNPEIGACSTWMENFGDQNKILKMPVFPMEIYFGFLKNNCFGHGPSMVRKSLLIENNIRYDNDYYYSEDTFFWANIMMVAKLQTIPIVLYKYRKHKTQMTTERREKMTNSANRAKNFHFQQLLSQLNIISEANLYPTDQTAPIEISVFEKIVKQLFLENRERKLFENKLFETTLLSIYKDKLLNLHMPVYMKISKLLKFMKADIFSYLPWVIKTNFSIIYHS
jgi:glycosyltransferase involved in cell wall biosynthesis